jgi:hypothetical protein
LSATPELVAFMRSVALALALLMALPVVADARGHYGSDYYTNVIGHHVHRPEHSRTAPQGASARCRDGTFSFSEHHSGTCSHHGGVSDWL